MTDFIHQHSLEIMASGICLATSISLRLITNQIVRSYGKRSKIADSRTILVLKYIHLLLNIITLVGFIVIWGVHPKDIFLTISSIATVIGVAMFAQWSILSNITAGVLLFFNFPFRIGDIILIHDKDFPIQAEIEDIRAFHLYLKTEEGEKIVYPNNLLLQKGISIIKSVE